MANFYGSYIGFGAGVSGVAEVVFGGENYGFVCGRHPEENATNRWSFDSGTQNGADWGTTVGTGRYTKGGHSDKANAYSYNTGGYGPPINEIVRFSMTSSSTSNDVGDLTQTGDNYASMGTATHGYIAGNSSNDQSRVEKFAFASSADAEDWSDLMADHQGAVGATNGTATYGYTMGGREPGVYSDRIQKINLTAQATATDASNLTSGQGRGTGGGTSSSTHGYMAGGYGAAGTSNVIDKFAFATDADATDVGDTTVSIHSRGGSSSTTYGYTLGGTGPLDVIERHSFSSDGDSADVGDLSEVYASPAGTQY